MATPAYQGANQPPAARGKGWLGSFGSFFGGSVPPYAVPSAKTTEASTAVVQVAKETNAEPPRACVIDPCTFPIDPAALAAGQIVIPRNLMSAIDPAALAAGQIAIVVPRGLACPEPTAPTTAG